MEKVWRRLLAAGSAGLQRWRVGEGARIELGNGGGRIRKSIPWTVS